MVVLNKIELRDPSRERGGGGGRRVSGGEGVTSVPTSMTTTSQSVTSGSGTPRSRIQSNDHKNRSMDSPLLLLSTSSTPSNSFSSSSSPPSNRHPPTPATSRLEEPIDMNGQVLDGVGIACSTSAFSPLITKDHKRGKKGNSNSMSFSGQHKLTNNINDMSNGKKVGNRLHQHQQDMKESDGRKKNNKSHRQNHQASSSSTPSSFSHPDRMGLMLSKRLGGQRVYPHSAFPVGRQPTTANNCQVSEGDDVDEEDNDDDDDYLDHEDDNRRIVERSDDEDEDDEEDEVISSSQTPVYEAIDPSRLSSQYADFTMESLTASGKRSNQTSGGEGMNVLHPFIENGGRTRFSPPNQYPYDGHLFGNHRHQQFQSQRNNFNHLEEDEDLFMSPSSSSTTAFIHPTSSGQGVVHSSHPHHPEDVISEHRILSSSSAVFPASGLYDPSNNRGHFISSSSPEHEMDNDESRKMNITGCTSFLDTRRLDRDKIEESLSLTGYFLSFLSLLVFILDSGTDVLLGYFLFRSQSHWFYPTLGITLLSSLVVNFFSLRWHLKDNKKGNTSGWAKKRSVWSSPRFWWRIVIHVLLLGPICRYFNLLKYGLLIRRETRRRQIMKELGRECRLATLGPIEMPLSLLRYPFRESFSLPRHLSKDGRDEDDYYIRFVHEDRDTAFLSLLKSFLESAPQLLLQSYIWTTSAMTSASTPASLHPNIVMASSSSSLLLTKSLVMIRVASMVTSLIQISWSLSSYHRALRRLIPTKRVMTTSGSILQFVWRFFTIGSRVSSLVLFTSLFGCWMIPISVAHWGVMTVWIMHQGTNFCDSSNSSTSTTRRVIRGGDPNEDPDRTDDDDEVDVGEGPRSCQEYLFNMIIGVVYLLCFISVKDEPTRIKYAAFYSITFAENVIFALSWYFSTTIMTPSKTHMWFQLPILAWVFASFFTGIFFMILYYSYFHPNGRPLRINRAAKCC